MSPLDSDTNTLLSKYLEEEILKMCDQKMKFSTNTYNMEYTALTC